MLFNASEWQEKLNQAMLPLEGWCTLEKALKLVEVIITNQIHQVLEIGIYGGKSLIPMALAVQAVNSTQGNCFGIDAWSNEVAVEVKTSHENDEWWSKLDIITIKNNFLKSLTQSSLVGIIRIIELPVTECLKIFKEGRYLGKIGLIHVDGNHSRKQALRDVQLAYEILPANGILVLDDLDWLTVADAHSWLKQHSETIFETTTYGIYRIKKTFRQSLYQRFQRYINRIVN